MVTITRRGFATLAAGSAAAAAMGQSLPGSTLVHEHVMVDFGGADVASPSRYDADEVFRAARPKLEELALLGCVRMLECTPNFIGRDPALLRRLSDATGIELWTNTGLYAAASYKYLPGYAKTESAQQLAERWIREHERGISGVRPRFIKIGVNKGPLGEWDRKVVRAAALCSKETGLTIAAHTGDGAAAEEELAVVGEIVAPSKFVWVHAQNELDHEVHARVARAGAWVEFDGIRGSSINWHRQCVEAMARRDLLNRTLISQDSGWYHVGEPGGGDYRGYTPIYTLFLPLLNPDWHRALLVDNPRNAFGA
jgi:phosphotriesterase-related protein